MDRSDFLYFWSCGRCFAIPYAGIRAVILTLSDFLFYLRMLRNRVFEDIRYLIDHGMSTYAWVDIARFVGVEGGSMYGRRKTVRVKFVYRKSVSP